jgi:hypothetical protein
MMTRTSAAASAVLGLLIISLFAADGRAQLYRLRRRPVQSIPIEGKVIKATRAQIAMVEDKGNKPWLVTLLPVTKILVSGTAKLDYLKAGLIIEFKADFDGKNVKDKVGDLTIVTLSPEKSLGAYPEGGGAAADKAAPEKPAPGKRGGKPTKSDAAPAQKDKDPADAAEGAKRYQFVGKIKGVKENHLLVDAGNKKVQIDLTDDAKIAVAVTDLALAVQGDEISVKGRDYKGTSGACVADDVKITMVKPLSNPKKVPPAAKAGSDSKPSLLKKDDDSSGTKKKDQ